ncbi:methyltransferase [Lipingzhangella sp. LS1_29]|uniref:Methyltransferase n=1 Tax=Lipingzhangella rawalii TaxID=2055835 RepID=A0ABU2H1I4_9ACTN|nr:methyltransferase [Lipingzhangella rawalii]MDS1269156.1 methyltransferase [Lipingzhangella rawalii]
MTPHYFDPDPQTGSEPRTVSLVLPDLYLPLRTDRAMFSADHVDLGTRILLETVPPPPRQGTLVDLGCGYGPIALTMASRAPQASVLGVDVNERAVELAGYNAHQNHLYNVDFKVGSDPMLVDDHLDVQAEQAPAHIAALWSNPPIRIGKPALHHLLTTWLARLAPTASAHLVVQRNLGADTLHRWLETQSYPCTRIASRSGYRVLRVDAPTSIT